MIRLGVNQSEYFIEDPQSKLRSKHIAQIEYYGFDRILDSTWQTKKTEGDRAIREIAAYLSKQQVEFQLDGTLSLLFDSIQKAENELAMSREIGELVKEGSVTTKETSAFLDYIEAFLPRQLKEHQVKAALHLLLVKNAANFSVPGAGKTSVVLAVYSWLKSRGEVDSLFIVGPPSCFRPWRDEYVSTLGAEPSFEILAGGDVEERQLKYYRPKERQAELYLTSFQTLMRDINKVTHLLTGRGSKFYLVIDEAHYIKNQDGIWAKTVLTIAPLVKRRCILTGTPFPHSYVDAFNLFDTLYPVTSPITGQDKHQLKQKIRAHRDSEAAAFLESKIHPLFYRVRKSDLRLANQDFLPPTIVEMNELERELYDTVIDRIQVQSGSDFVLELDTAQRLQKGRMIRLRQAVSYAKLLSSALENYDETLVDESGGLTSRLIRYDDIEAPGKIAALLDIVSSLRRTNEKVVIWSNFIGTLDLLKRVNEAKGWKAEIICGNTPKEDNYTGDVITREAIIDTFKNENSGMDILIANPAACAESISLHRTCSNAIYYDLSYNCAQYLQSLDRIHRVGGSEEKVSHYYYLQYADTFEGDILENLMQKSRNMSRVIDQEFPVCEMELIEDNLAAYQRIFRERKG